MTTTERGLPTQMDSAEGGMGKQGFSDRSYDRSHYLALSSRTHESLRQAAQDENMDPNSRRSQIKAPLVVDGDILPEMIGDYQLEGSVPLGSVHPKLPPSHHFVWYGQSDSSLLKQRLEEHQPNLQRRVGLANELAVASSQADFAQQRLLNQINSVQFTLLSDIPDQLRPDANRLWFDSFEWTPKAIDELLNQARTPDSGVYISAVQNRSGDLISLCFAMEQRMTLEVAGQPIDVSFFELTDLITDPNRRESGAGSACTLNLMQQIARDFENPIMIAEGNVAAGTHRLLGRLGFTSELAEDGGVRLLRDHVAVGDGISYFKPAVLEQIEDAGLSGQLAPALLALGENLTNLRDFLVLYLPSSSLNNLRQNVFSQLS